MKIYIIRNINYINIQPQINCNFLYVVDYLFNQVASMYTVMYIFMPIFLHSVI